MRTACATLCAAALAALIALAAAGSAAAAEPWWHLQSDARPSVLPAAIGSAPGVGEVVLNAENLGNASSVLVTAGGAHSPAVLSDTLPPGLRATGISGTQPKYGGALTETTPLVCSLEHLSCETVAPVAPFDQIEVRIAVEVLSGAAASEVNSVSIAGGGGPSQRTEGELTIGGQPPSFGLEHYELGIEGEGGAPDLQAGSHPYQVTGTIALDQGADAAPLTATPQAAAVAPASDIVAKLPPGLIADPGSAPRCLLWQFLLSDGSGNGAECSPLTAIGVASVTADDPGHGTLTFAAPIFNIEPEAGEPASFGFFVPEVNAPVLLTTSVRSGPGEDWGVDLNAAEIPEDAGLISARVTFWGAPRRQSHDNARGWGCLQAARGQTVSAYETCDYYGEEASPQAFVTVPTSCDGSQQSSVEARSSEATGGSSFTKSVELAAFMGCEALPFTPEVSLVPTTHSAASPSGLAVNLSFDTEGLTSASGLAQSDLQDTTLTLPEGVTINPSAGVGLAGCSEAQYAQVTIGSPEAASCPEASKLGTVEIETPLLFTTVYGGLYLAQPYENPFSEAGHPRGSLLALYVIARSRAERGILIKLAGEVSANPLTGQLTVSFRGDPQLPFSRFSFHFREGEQAPLITPSICGSFSGAAQLTPFSAPDSSLNEAPSFAITAGSEGSTCPGALPPFAPAITSTTLNAQAGVYSPLAIELTRTDAMQEIADYSTVLPEGMTANLTGVPFCPEADIEAARAATGTKEEAEPSCPAASEIGDTLVGTGVGPVLDYVPGKLYLAGPFHGKPFSVVSVTSAVIGPFDLGTIVIRFALEINPYTGQVSISPTGSEPIPTIIDGIVTHVRDIRVSIDRSNFTLGPTSCAAKTVSSTLTSALGSFATISTPYQVDGCKELRFEPKFSARTSGKTSRKRGASLSVKLTTPGKLGAESNIKEVKVELPKQLPSQLTTLQQACTDKQFEANPAACPAGSFVGHAKAVTPILPEPLTGPAIFVSHGSSEFPSLVLALKGYGVNIDLVGSTFISNKGITSTTFKTVPDEPVGSFELTLPEGKHPALAAPEGLCGKELIMPTTFIAQNGKRVVQRTKIAVSGCAAILRRQEATALARCRRRDAHRRHARELCERRARKRLHRHRRSSAKRKRHKSRRRR